MLIGSPIFADPCAGYEWFFSVLGLMGLYGMWVGLRQYGFGALWPWTTEGVSQGMEDEALACVLADPYREFHAEVQFLAGRAALRAMRSRA